MSELINIKQLAERLGVTRQTIHNMLRDDRLPVAPIVGLRPRKWRSSDVEAWITARDCQAAE